MFSILVLNEVKDGLPVAEITIGDHMETFPLRVNFWSPERYRTQWREAIARLVFGRDRACSALIVDVQKPGDSSGLVWWPMYRMDDKVYFRHQIAFFDAMVKPFELQDPYTSVPPRIDDATISEWVVPLDCLNRFLQKM